MADPKKPETAATTETVVTTEATPETKPTETSETTVSDTTTATTEFIGNQQGTNWDFDKLVSTIATLVKPEPKTEVKPDTQSETKPDAELRVKQEVQPAPDEVNKYQQIEQVLHNVLVAQANVPDVLKPLLPRGISELQDFLSSDSYRQLSAALKPTHPSAKPTVNDPAPAPPDTPKSSAAPKTVSDLDLSVLAELDQFFL